MQANKDVKDSKIIFSISTKIKSENPILWVGMKEGKMYLFSDHSTTAEVLVKGDFFIISKGISRDAAEVVNVLLLH